MEHLSARGLNCPLPVRNRAGAALGRLAGRPAAMVTFLEGMSVRRPEASHCAQVGEALARMHLAGEGFALSRPNALSVEGWGRLFAQAQARADQVQPGLAAALAAELAHAQAHWPQDLPRGLIHADLFPDNVFFLGGALSGLIDFYFACEDALAYDLAICLNPLLARGAAFRFLLTRLYDWLNTPRGALVKMLDPLEYLRKLRFHRSARSAAEYGV